MIYMGYKEIFFVNTPYSATYHIHLSGLRHCGQPQPCPSGTGTGVADGVHLELGHGQKTQTVDDDVIVSHRLIHSCSHSIACMQCPRLIHSTGDQVRSEVLPPFLLCVCGWLVQTNDNKKEREWRK
jgi:hypothetical protein